MNYKKITSQINWNKCSINGGLNNFLLSFLPGGGQQSLINVNLSKVLAPKDQWVLKDYA